MLDIVVLDFIIYYSHTKMSQRIKLTTKNKDGVIRKFSAEVLKFEHFLKNLGYYDSSPIRRNVQRINSVILEKYNDQYNIELIGFIYYYPNKKSYLWRCYNELKIEKNLPKKEIIKYMIVICKGIIFPEKTRIAEVGWEINYFYNLMGRSKRDITLLYFNILKDLKTVLRTEFCGIKPKPGDVLIGKPGGLKFGFITNLASGIEGSRQRGISTQRFLNFGKPNIWNDQYARYDENLNLNPI